MEIENAKKEVQHIIALAEKNGAVEAKDDQAVRTGELYNPQVGETIHILDDSPILDLQVRGSNNKFKAVFGYETTTGEPRQISLSSFTKSIFLVDDKGNKVIDPTTNRQKRLSAGGTVHDWMVTKTSVKECGELLRGHDLTWKNEHPGTTLRYGTKDVVDNRVYDVDFVGAIPA